ncbi:hypothetical protein BH23ACT12_BH23ACT12_00890 [soil metagenome]
MAREAMRKWICVGVLGGLLEFGIVYQVAFSGTDSPSPEALAETDGANEHSSRANKAGRNRRTARHIAAAAGVAGTAGSANPQAAGTGAAKRATVPPPSTATVDASSASAAPAPSSPNADDSLGDTLKAAVSAIAALPMSLGLTGDVPPVPPVAIPGLLEPVAENGEPVDVARLPIEDMIRHVFGPEGDKAVEVARCESTLRPQARKGQFQGLFQMGANERADYGHGPDALAQVVAAHALFLDRGWQPWTCA